jgi:hypothetical protein
MKDQFEMEMFLRKVQAAYHGDRFEAKKIAEEMISAAQLYNNLELEFDAKILYLQCCVTLDQSEEILATYPWVLAQMDNYPNRFDENSGLWAYKWVMACLTKFPHISLEQIQGALADMERRFLAFNANNVSVISYYKAVVAKATGDIEGLKFHLAAFRKLKNKRNSLGDCKACVGDSVVRAYKNAGQFEEAIEEAEPIIAKKLTCAEVPERTYPSVILSYWHLGKAEEAHLNYLKYKRFIKPNKPQLDDIADILTYLGLTNKLTKGVELFEQKFQFTLNRSALMDNFDYYLGALVLFGQLKLKKKATVKLNMPKEFELYTLDGEYTVATIYDYLMEQATDVAQQFDKRNGNTFFSERIEKQLKLIGA